MPQITSENAFGTLDKWVAGVGDYVEAGAPLCEVTLDDGITIAVTAKSPGYLAEQAVPEGGGEVRVHDVIARMVRSVEDVGVLASPPTPPPPPDPEAEGAGAPAEAAKALTVALRELEEAGLMEPDTERAKKLRAMARHANPALLAAYEASFGESGNAATFNAKFFLREAREIAEEELASERSDKPREEGE